MNPIRDCWQSDDGSVRLLCGDALEILPTLEAGSVDAVFDPPYGLQMAEGRRLHAYKDVCKHGGKIGGNGATLSTEYGETDWDRKPLTKEQWDAVRAVSVRQIVFGYEYLIDVLGRAPRVLCWDKKCRNGWDDYFSDFELAWCSVAGTAKMFRHMWMGMLRASGEERIHPMQKPVALMEWCFGFDIGQTVLDPFMGSGTTIVAAIRTGRRAIGIELDPAYFASAVRRCQDELARFPLWEQPKPKQLELIP